MIITKLALPRRTFLRGMGATLALPLLDAMVPALSAMAKTAAKPVRRLGFIYVPNGVNQTQWKPSGEGTSFELSPTLSPLAPFRDQLLVVSGLAHREAEPKNDGSAEHPRATAAWLSGVHAYAASIDHPEIRLATTADQIAAQELGKHTRLPSLELALETPSAVSCDAGAAICFYASTISWRTPTTPVPMETHPRVVFERLFGDGGSPAEQLARIRKTRSILDSVVEEAIGLEKTLGASDRTKLAEYLDAVREVEQRIQIAEQHSAESELSLPDRPVDIPDTFEEHAKLMFDLQVLAYRADITRVISLMIGTEQSNRGYPNLGAPEGNHSVSHHQNNPELLSKYARVNKYHCELVAYYLEKLRSTPDGDGSLLDHLIILYGSGLGDGNLHQHYDLPALLVGGGAGQLDGGRYLKYPETPMANLLLTVLDKVGVPAEKLGDSTGRLDLQYLSAV